MTPFLRSGTLLIALALLCTVALAPTAAQGPPDLTKFGYPTVAKSTDLAPDQAATITAGDQSVAIKAGTFDNPVTFDLLTGDLAQAKNLAPGRTVRAAFAFRVTDKTTKAIVGAFKQPVMYSYSGKDAQSTDAILNTTAANPPVVTPNPTPITFDGKANHPFTGAGVGWLLVSAPTTTGAAASAPAATGTGGTTASIPATTLPQTGYAHIADTNVATPLALGGGALLLVAGAALIRRRRIATP